MKDHKSGTSTIAQGRYTAGKATTFSVRCWEGQLAVIQAAALAVRMTQPEYILAKLLPQAAADAGIDLPRFPEFRRRPFHDESPVETAARSLGLSVEEFKQRSALAAAAQVLAPRKVSGTHHR